MINTYIPMAGAIKSLLNIVVFVVLLIWVLQAFGLIGSIPGFACPRSSDGARCALTSRVSQGKVQVVNAKASR